MNGDGCHPGYTPSTTHILLSVQLSTKYKIRMSNSCAQHDTVAELKHCDILRVPMAGRNQNFYITPAFSGSHGGENST